MGTLVASGCCARKVSMMDFAERGCPTLGSSSVRRLVLAGGVLAQTISHAPLAAFTSVPGPHGLQVAGGGGEGEGGGGEGEGGGGEGEGGGGEGEGGGGDGVGSN
eukprot:scaffold13289_cov59-Phaeocystis_antarctica.AAC.4